MNSLERLPIDRNDVSQDKLDICGKVRSNLFQWNGQFSPQFIEALIARYAGNDFHILDPFMGSGTVLYEAARHGIQASGTDINPAAYQIARTYSLCSHSLPQRKASLAATRKLVSKHAVTELPLFSDAKPQQLDFDEIIKKLVAESKSLAADAPEHIILDSFITLVDKDKYRKNPQELFPVYEKLSSIVNSLPETDASIQAFNVDCRELPLAENSIDLVITSPPYINVFNYHQQYRKNTEALGWHVLDAAKSEFGSNRKHRSNRFLTTIQYCVDIAGCLVELHRVCKPNSRIIFVVGRESNVSGIAFYNGRLVTEIATACGFDFTLRQERVFKNKFGQSIYEDILHFEVPSSIAEDCIDRARSAALSALTENRTNAEGSVLSNIEDAINSASNVMPSPRYRQCA